MCLRLAVVRHIRRRARDRGVFRCDFQCTDGLTTGRKCKADCVQPRVIQCQGVRLHRLVSSALDVANGLTARIKSQLTNHIGFGDSEVVGATGRRESTTVGGLSLHLRLEAG